MLYPYQKITDYIERFIFRVLRFVYYFSPALAIKVKYFFILKIFSKITPKKYLFLSIFFQYKDVRDFFGLVKSNSYKKPRFFNLKSTTIYDFDKLLLVGPQVDNEEIIEKDFYKNSDAIVQNKITKSSLKSSKKQIYILNSYWSNRNINILKELKESKKDCIIFTPEETAYSYGYSKYIKNYLKLPFRISAMGLQRTLLILPLIINHNNIDIIGFDLGLSEKPYSETYPSAFSNDFIKKKNEIAKSYFSHSFIYNYVLTKNLINQYPNTIGLNSLKELLDLGLNRAFSKYLDLYKIR